MTIPEHIWKLENSQTQLGFNYNLLRLKLAIRKYCKEKGYYSQSKSQGGIQK